MRVRKDQATLDAYVERKAKARAKTQKAREAKDKAKAAVNAAEAK